MAGYEREVGGVRRGSLDFYSADATASGAPHFEKAFVEIIGDVVTNGQST